MFDFGAIHQIEEWPDAVAEVRRVLRPGGRFFFEEVASPLLRWTLRFTVEGWPPPQAHPFSREAFLAELPARELHIDRRLASRGLLLTATGFSAGLVGDLVGCGGAWLIAISLTCAEGSQAGAPRPAALLALEGRRDARPGGGARTFFRVAVGGHLSPWG